MKLFNIKKYRNPEKAAGLVEYGLLVALISCVCIASVRTTGSRLSCMFAKVSKVVTEGSMPSGPWSGYGATNCGTASGGASSGGASSGGASSGGASTSSSGASSTSSSGATSSSSSIA